jgi:hypothetical protein
MEFSAGIQCRAGLEIIFRAPAIDRRNARAVAFGLEAVKPVPAADVQKTPAAQIVRYSEQGVIAA